MSGPDPIGPKLRRPRAGRRPAASPELGPLLRALMARHGRTAKAVAEDAGVDRAYLHEILRGDKSPTLPRLEAICAAAGGHVADLYDPALEPAPARGAGA